ncbi:MAG: hypothetical protein IJK54_05275 [Clostridia bacterium]|nr:hypothetical protein [Clostridia bacterium]
MKKRIVVFALAAVLLLMAVGCAKPLPEEGTYMIGVTLSGGTGKASIESPAQLVVFSDGYASLLVIWSSDKYDYMLVGGDRYEPAIRDGHSVFVIPVENINEPLTVIADTTAMSMPHEIEYTITFDAASLAPAS